jgi:hypothetical protein
MNKIGPMDNLGPAVNFYTFRVDFMDLNNNFCAANVVCADSETAMKHVMENDHFEASYITAVEKL